MQIIRKAAADDIDAVCRIYDNIHTECENGRIYTGWVRGVYPVRATAEGALERGELFVLEADGNVVGSAVLNRSQGETYKNTPWKYAADDSCVMVIHTLVIDPYVKGKGFGSAFAAFYEQYAREHGCSCLRLDTNERNSDARAFYKKLGFSEAGIAPCVFNGIDGVRLVMLEKKL